MSNSNSGSSYKYNCSPTRVTIRVECFTGSPYCHADRTLQHPPEPDPVSDHATRERNPGIRRDVYGSRASLPLHLRGPGSSHVGEGREADGWVKSWGPVPL